MYERPQIESKKDVKGIMGYGWGKPKNPKPPSGGYR
jgi:hypothetical protein